MIFQEYFRSIPNTYPVIMLSTSVTTEINFELHVKLKSENQQSHKRISMYVIRTLKHMQSENRTAE
jgi:hypothetical protein